MTHEEIVEDWNYLKGVVTRQDNEISDLRKSLAESRKTIEAQYAVIRTLGLVLRERGA